MNNTCYGACFTPETHKAYIDWWSNFPKEKKLNIILDNSRLQNIEYESFQYTENDIRNNFNFKHGVSRSHYWNHHGNRNIIWFYAYLRMINFYIKNKDYDYYWFFDDDVYCNNWDLFLSGFENDNTDFLSYFLFKNKDVLGYNNVPMVDNKMHSGGDWFSRFPGHTDTLEPNTSQLFGSFFAIVRFSNKALEHIVNLTEKDYFGYGEGFVPTSLANTNMSMGSIFNPDNTSNYFDVNKVKLTHKNQKITWEWL